MIIANSKLPRLADEALGLFSMVWVVALIALSIHWAITPAAKITIMQPGATIYSRTRDVLIPSPYKADNACVTLTLMQGSKVIRTYYSANEDLLVIHLPDDLPKGEYTVQGFIQYSSNPINKDSVTLNLARLIYE